MHNDELLRYSRHILLPEIDIPGQQALLESRVLIVGLGGLGSPVAMYLAAAGVGALHLADADEVDLSNLQRQILHTEETLGLLKVDSAIQQLHRTNSQTQILTHPVHLCGDALEKAVSEADLVCDCSDRFSTRFAVNRACQRQGKPLVSGAAIRFSGQLAVFDPRQDQAPCYACLYQESADDEALSCAQSGVLSPLVGVIGSLQAVETLKLLTRSGRSQAGFLLTYDALNGEFRRIQIQKDRQCQACSEPWLEVPDIE